MTAAFLGDFAEDSTLHFMWDSADADGASITRATNGTISVYKNNSTTQSTAGITDTEDFDSLTGVHAVTIDLSADAFYATGANYTVVLSGATIDGQTVNATLAHFSIQNRVASVSGTVDANLISILSSTLTETSTSNLTDNFVQILDLDTTTARTVNDIGAVVGSPINASLTHVKGQPLTETSAGNLADNFSQVFDLDTTTTKTANDLGSATVSGTVDASVVAFLGTSITEGSAGRFSANMSQVYNNDNVTTTKKIDDLGTAVVSGTVNADLVSIMGETLTQTSSGNLGENFSQVYDLDTTTTKTIDDLGTASIVGTVNASIVEIMGTTLVGANIPANWQTFFQNGGDASTTTLATIDSAADNTGAGPYAITVTYEDTSAAPIQGVLGRLTNGAAVNLTGTSDASGEIVFNVPSQATYTVTGSKAGYNQPGSPTTVTAATGTYVLTAESSIAVPSDTTRHCTGYGYVFDDAVAAESGVTVYARVKNVNSTVGNVPSNENLTTTTDSNGRFEFDKLFRGHTYEFTAETGGFSTTPSSGLNGAGQGSTGATAIVPTDLTILTFQVASFYRTT